MKPAEFTRQAILDHAASVFAESGFDRASVREITQRADVNQASINYHFKSKEALYHQVLRLAVAAFSDISLLDDEIIDRVDREEAVRLFIRQQVLPLLKYDEMGRYLRIFAWETLAPTPVFREFLSIEKLPMMMQAERIVRRFLPNSATVSEITVATIWLTQQVAPFIRNYEILSKHPFNLKVDKTFVEGLSHDLSRMAIAGLCSYDKS